MINQELDEIQAPDAPDENAGLFETETFKSEFKEYRARLKSRTSNMEKAFALVLGQCSPSLRDKLEADENWDVINASSDVMELLTLIKSCMYTQATTKHASHSLYDAEERLYCFKQTENMSNAEFKELLRSHVEVVEHLGGQPGVTDARIQALMEEPDDADDADAVAQAREEAAISAREEYMAMMLLLKSDPNRYGGLVADIQKPARTRIVELSVDCKSRIRHVGAL